MSRGIAGSDSQAPGLSFPHHPGGDNAMKRIGMERSAGLWLLGQIVGSLVLG